MRLWISGITRPRLALVGAALLVIATLIFVLGLVWVVAGVEVALMPMMFAFGIFTLGFGVLVAARR